MKATIFAVALSMVLLSTAALADDTYVLTSGSEFLLDANFVYVGAANYQGYQSVAFDGTNYLVVWSDARQLDYDIYAARVDQSGAILDSAGIFVFTGPGYQYYPSVAFDGTNYLVVWTNYGHGVDARDIYGARISRAGVVLDPDGIAISTADYDQLLPSVAFDGTNYLVVWYDERSGSSSDIYGARVAPSGVVLDTAGIAISTNPHSQRSPKVAFDGTNYLTVWHDNRGDPNSHIYGARINQSGVVLDTAGIPISTGDWDHTYPSLSFDGTNYLVVWEDSRIESHIYGTRVDPSGAVLDTGGLAISTATGDKWYPKVAFDGANYLVVWSDERSGREVYGARVDPSGAVLDPAGFAISTWGVVGYYPTAAFDGTNYLVTWSMQPTSYADGDLWGARVNQAGVVLDTSAFAVSTSANDQRLPSAASDGTDYLVVWQDERGDPYSDIYGIRVDEAGGILDASAFAISTADYAQEYPSVAFCGTNYLAVWSDERAGDSHIYGARIDQSGVVLDTGGIQISTREAYFEPNPSVACDGTNCLVTWVGDDGIYCARVSQSGLALDTVGVLVSAEMFRTEHPSVAFDGTNYLIVWSDRNESFDIYGARVDQEGAVIDTIPIGICTTPGTQLDPAVAFDGTNYLVVWHWYESGSGQNIYGARVNPSGAVLDTAGFSISTRPNYEAWHSVAFNGTDYVVTWRDLDISAEEYDIHGALVSQSGVVVDTFVVSVEPGIQTHPTLAHGPGNKVLIAYTGWTDSINGQPANTMRIWGKFYTTTGVDEDPSEACLPQSFVLEQNYPNPFNPMTKIAYSLPKACRVKLTIYNILGQRVATLVDEHQQAGYRSIRWDASSYGSGVYFYRFQAGDFVETRKMVFMK